jgi:hypothetical protein
MKRRDPYFKLSEKLNYLANDVAALFDRMNQISARISAFKIEYAENWDLFNNQHTDSPVKPDKPE